MPATSAGMTNWKRSRYQTDSSLHRALFVEAVLIVLDDRGDGLEDRVAIGPFDDVLQIEILYREMIVAVAERAANRCKVRLFHRLDHVDLPGDVAIDGDDRAINEVCGVVTLGAIEGRRSLVLRLVVGDEFLVGIVRQIVDPFLCARDTDRVLALPRQRRFVNGERRIKWNLALEACLDVLIEELHAGCPRIEHEHRVGLGGPHLGKLRGEVELVGPPGVFLADDLALEGRLDTGEHVLAGRVVRADQIGILDALLIHIEADRRGVWSFCQEVEKKYGEHNSPAICDGPALALIMMVFESSAGLSDARSTFDQI